MSRAWGSLGPCPRGGGRKANHEAITQAFRKEWSYSRSAKGRKPDPPYLLGILTRVYSEYPIPQLIGINP